jgi:hypothetical protein
MKLDAYWRDAVLREDFLRGSAIYWDTEPKEPLVLPEGAAEDQGEFHEWLITDSCLSSGKTVVESFLGNRRNRLTEEERAIVEALSGSFQSVYEIQEVREGSGVTVKDVFTGDEMDVEDISISYSPAQWDVVHMRVYATGAFTGSRETGVLSRGNA